MLIYNCKVSYASTKKHTTQELFLPHEDNFQLNEKSIIVLLTSNKNSK